MSLRKENCGLGSEGLGELRIESQGAVAGRECPFDPAAGLVMPLVKEGAHVGQAGVGQSKSGVERDGLLVHLYGELEVRTGDAPRMIAPAQEIIVGLRVLRGFLGDGALFLG